MMCPSHARLTAASTGDDIAAELHAETCARCRAELDAMTELVALARRVPTPPALSAERRAAIRAGALATIDAADPATRIPVRPAIRLRIALYGIGAVAAAAAIAIAAWDAHDAVAPGVHEARATAPVPAPPPAAAITEPAPRAPGPPPQIAQIAPRARPPVLAAPNVATGLPDGASTIDARNRDPVHLVAGDTAVDIAASKVEVTSRRGVVTMVRVFAGAAEIRHTGRRQILSAGEIWVRPETPPHATAEASLEAFATGWIALRAGHYSAAIAAFDRADDPVAAEDAAYWAAIASARAGATGDAVRRLRKFVAQFPTSSRADAARRTLARLAP